MKTNRFKFGKYTCRSYMKPAGTGFEVGFHFGPGKPIFVGNFINRTEANQWWTLMNKKFKTYTTKYWVPKNAPVAWYKRFISHAIYQDYYKFAQKAVAKHMREHTKKTNTEIKKYSKLKKNFKPAEKLKLVRKAA